MDALTALITSQVEGTGGPGILLECVERFLSGLQDGFKDSCEVHFDSGNLSLTTSRNTSCGCHPEYETTHHYVRQEHVTKAVREEGLPDDDATAADWCAAIGRRVGAQLEPA